MSELIEVQVPDIGDFAEVEVIELLVKPGDVVAVEQSLITVESDKASMEIPSSVAGVVRELRVKVGDKVSKGSVVLALDAGAAASAPAPAPHVPSQAPTQAQAHPPAPVLAQQGQPAGVAPGAARGHALVADMSCNVLVLGGGPGGYSAAFRAADLGLKAIIVERYPTCLLYTSPSPRD